MTIYWILIPFFITMLLMPVGVKILTYLKVMDMPNERKVHEKPIPSTGGIIFFITFVISIIILNLFPDLTNPIIPIDKNTVSFMISVSFLVLIGVIDDMSSLSASFKFIAQIFSAFIYVSISGIYLQIPLLNEFPLFSFITVIFFIVAVTNSLNLIDGLDGLAAGLSIISFSVLSFFVGGQFGLLTVVAISVMFGFLRANTFPAIIFMGDSGSYFLGYTLAVMSLQSVIISDIPIWLPILILGIPLIDTTLVFVTRALNKKSIFKPDKNHLHHRLQKLGISHKNTVFLMYSIQVIFAFIAIGSFVELSRYYWAALVVIILLSIQHVYIILTDDLKWIKKRSIEVFQKLFDYIPMMKHLYIVFFIVLLLLLSAFQISNVCVLTTNIFSDLNVMVVFLAIVISYLFIADNRIGRSSNVSVGMIILAGTAIFYTDGHVIDNLDNPIWYLMVAGIIFSSIGMYKDRHYFDSPTEFLLIGVMLIFSLFPSTESPYTPLAYTSFHLVILFLVYKILLQSKFIRKYNIIYIINIITLCIMIMIGLSLNLGVR